MRRNEAVPILEKVRAKGEPTLGARASSQKASLGFMCQTLRAYESNPIWTSDSKITPFRDAPRLTLYSGYRGAIGTASAAVVADGIIPQMVAEAASGQLAPKDAAARAEQRARRYYKT